MLRILRVLVGTAAVLVAGCGQRPPDQMIAAVYDVSPAQFGLRVIAPADRIREYAVCKATWVAENMKATTMSLGNPIDQSADPSSPLARRIPPGWAVLDTMVYLTSGNPDGNPAFNVAERAKVCRSLSLPSH